MKSKDKSIEKFEFLTNYTSVSIRKILLGLDNSLKQRTQEIRLRTNSPIILSTGSKNTIVSNSDKPPYIVTKEDIAATFEYISGSSVYSILDQLKNGFITVSGGHRIGLCGRAVIKDNDIFTIKDISSINFRISKEFKGCGDYALEKIIKGARVLNTLIVSPPSCGKTTMLRDIARQLSNGIPRLLFEGARVAIVDERSEIAGVYKGEAQNNVGRQTDVLDACPKALGIMLLLRSMSPQIIITDELGKKEDIEAVCSAHNTGVCVIASVHGGSIDELFSKAVLKPLLENKIFNLALLLNARYEISDIRYFD